MKRFILILAFVLLLVAVIAPAALAASNTASTGSALARTPGICPDRACPFGSGGSCFCPGLLSQHSLS